MFKVPEWETDVAETNICFTKRPKKNRRNESAITKSIQNKDEDIFSKEYEGFQMDELLINAKKKKLNDIFLKEDCEEKLFGDTKQTKSILNSTKITKQKFKSGATIVNIPSNADKFPKKRKFIDDTNKEISNIILSAKKIKLNDNASLITNNSLQNEKVNKKAKKSKLNDNSSLITNNTLQEEKVNKKAKKIKVNNNEFFSKNKITNSSQKETVYKNSKTDSKSKVISEEAEKKNETIHTNTTEVLDKKVKINHLKKEKIKKLLEQSHRSPINVAGNKLRERMMERLKAAQFRYLNEKLYTSSGDEAQQIFQSDPAAFRTYHQGYQLQVKKWPVNPLDVIVKKIKKMPKSFVIADMGCGEAALSKRVPHKVHSFDLVSSAPGVVACDMARTPLLKSSTDVVVYCLALMGTELTRYLVEANRVLKTGGQLLIAEVESRFEDVHAFTKDVERLGFRLKDLDKEHSVFFFMQFAKTQEPPVKKAKLPVLNLRPCLYKKR